MNQEHTLDTKAFKLLGISSLAIILLTILVIFYARYSSIHLNQSVLNIPSLDAFTEEHTLSSSWKNAHFHSMVMFRTLFLPDSTYQTTEPDLAENLTILNDGLTYEITMKDGIVWSDGEPLTVEDVVFSIEAALKATGTNGLYTLAFSKIMGYDEFMTSPTSHLQGLSVANNTLTIQLATQYPSMEQILAQFIILPKHILELEDPASLNTNEYWKNPVVSGMYKLEESYQDDILILVKNDLYVGNEPSIDTIWIHKNYQQESLDYFPTNNLTDIINYRVKSGMEEHLTSSLFYRYFIFNMEGADGHQNEAMQDVRVRKAIGHAINREQILEKTYESTGTLINSGVPDTHYASTHQSIEYNPELAIELLAEANYDFSRPLTLTYYHNDNITESFMHAVANDLRAVGFTVEFFLVNSAAKVYEERAYDLSLKGLAAFELTEWYAEYDNENDNFKQIFGGDTAFEPLVESLSTEIDQSEINKILTDLQNLEHEEFYKLPLFTLNQYVYINSDRFIIPDDVEFGNTWYRNDIQFDQWVVR